MTSTITTAPRPAKSTWQCGYCSSGTHGRCRGATLNQGKILTCSCDQHPTVQRCLECGNTRADELTGWACTNPTDCADAIAARSAANPLREELRIVRELGGEARRRALDERLQRQIKLAVEVSGIDRELGEDVASDLPIERRRRAPRKPRVARPTSGTCICGCEGATKGGRFLPGHDAKLKSALKKQIEDGDQAAYERMVELGWERFAQIAVAARDKALAS